MPRVRFVPLHGQDSVCVPDIVDAAGEPIYFAIGADAERDLSDADAAIVLTNPNFVDVSTGKNPLVASPEPAPAAPAIVAPAPVADSSEV